MNVTPTIKKQIHAPSLPPPKQAAPSKKVEKSRGRPCLLSKECEAKLLGAIETGMPLKYAAQYAGICYETMNRWRIRGELENAPPEFRHFCQAVRQSQAIAMHKLVSRINKASDTDWRAAAWMLERRHPEEFSRPLPIENAKPDGKSITPNYDVNCEILQRIKKQNICKKFICRLGEILQERQALREEAALQGKKLPLTRLPIRLREG